MARPKRQPLGDRVVPGEAPERTCALTRAKLAPAELIRFVRAPDATIVPDLANKLPGRGVWISLDCAAVELAAKQNVFARSLKRQVTVPDGLAAQVADLMRQRCIAAVAMANKAGLVVAGYAKVDAAITSGSVCALLHAAEAAEDGSSKLDRKLIAVHASNTPPAEGADGDAPQIVTDFTSVDLSLALGRENVVHAALSKGGATKYFLHEAGRYKRFRSNGCHAPIRPSRTRSNTEQV